MIQYILTDVFGFVSAIDAGKVPDLAIRYCASSEEFDSYYNVIVKYSSSMASVHIGGKGNILKNGFRMSYKGHNLHVMPPGSQKKGVAETSVAAYRSHDKETQAEKVARAVIEMLKAGHEVTDRSVSQQTGIQTNTVSARRNELEKGIEIDGVVYEFASFGRVKCQVTGKNVNAWGLVAQVRQLEIFE